MVPDGCVGRAWRGHVTVKNSKHMEGTPYPDSGCAPYILTLVQLQQCVASVHMLQ